VLPEGDGWTSVNVADDSHERTDHDLRAMSVRLLDVRTGRKEHSAHDADAAHHEHGGKLLAVQLEIVANTDLAPSVGRFPLFYEADDGIIKTPPRSTNDVHNFMFDPFLPDLLLTAGEPTVGWLIFEVSESASFGQLMLRIDNDHGYDATIDIHFPADDE
jgi:hypothetical protein